MLILATAILIIRDGLALACARKDNENDFGLPGGKLEPNESFEEAAARELKEETGFEGKDFQFVFERQDELYLVKVFSPKEYSGIVPSDEEQKKKGEGRVKFATLEELMTGSFGEYNRKLFKHLGLIK